MERVRRQAEAQKRGDVRNFVWISHKKKRVLAGTSVGTGIAVLILSVGD